MKVVASVFLFVGLLLAVLYPVALTFSGETFYKETIFQRNMVNASRDGLRSGQIKSPIKIQLKPEYNPIKVIAEFTTSSTSYSHINGNIYHFSLHDTDDKQLWDKSSLHQNKKEGADKRSVLGHLKITSTVIQDFSIDKAGEYQLKIKEKKHYFYEDSISVIFKKNVKLINKKIIIIGVILLVLGVGLLLIFGKHQK